jgi:ferredoxin-thioredoxin reductase catalytic subunit
MSINEGQVNYLVYKMIQILRKNGWVLNPNDKVVNGILKMVERNDGECPCHNESLDRHCPCSDYREKDVCHCGLYLKVEG